MATALDLPLDELIKRRQGEQTNQSRPTSQASRSRGGRGRGRVHKRNAEHVTVVATHTRKKRVHEEQRMQRPEKRRARRGILDRLGPKASDCELKITGLPYDVLEDDLHELFEQIGRVASVEVDYDESGRSEGCATITMVDADKAKLAVEQYDSIAIDSQPINVRLVGTESNTTNVRTGLFGTALKGLVKNRQPRRRLNTSAVSDDL